MRADWLPLLAELAHRQETRVTPRNTQQLDLFEQYTHVLGSLARKFPLIILLDDLQWADQASISLLFHLGRNLEGSRILIIGSYRPEEVAIGREGERHPLAPVINEFQLIFGDIFINVDLAESHNFVNAIIDSEPNKLGLSFRETLSQLTLGHPLYTIELLHGMQEREDLVKDQDGHWIEGASLNWEKLPARVEAVIAEARRVVADGPTYLSFDIDSLDPAFAPGTGTPEVGGITTVEAQALVRGLRGLDLIGGDVVEVSPPFDASGITALVGATMMYEILCILAETVALRKRPG
jgi:hypothetical protein